MLKHIEEYGKYVEITGFRNVKIENAKDFLTNLSSKESYDLELQLFNADLVATWQHLYFATLNALMAFKTNNNTSKTLALETALYSSAQRQIKKALELIGTKPDSKNVAILLISQSKESIRSALSEVSKRLGTDPDETVLDLSEEKNLKIKGAFDISDTELRASSSKGLGKSLVNLVIERAALLSTRL
jgi:tRNA threonylcarbamoyladenosine modification (KEOPS) complex Cgi121 subunit